MMATRSQHRAAAATASGATVFAADIRITPASPSADANQQQHEHSVRCQTVAFMERNAPVGAVLVWMVSLLMAYLTTNEINARMGTLTPGLYATVIWALYAALLSVASIIAVAAAYKAGILAPANLHAHNGEHGHSHST